MISIDQLGREIELSKPPSRLVSLVPSITETLFDLGLENFIAGRTRYCIHPNDLVKKIPVVGGTKKIVKERIENLKPDLVLANKEENTKEDIEWIAEKFPVWISDVVDVESAIEMIEQLGELTNRREQAEKISSDIKTSFENLYQVVSKPTVNYLIWKDPYMAAGSDTFINEMLNVAGFTNAISPSRYPTLTAKEIIDLHPDFIFLSTEPYRFTEKHVNELQKVFTKSKVVLVDGEMFSWYGSRMMKSAQYFKKLRNQLIY